MERDQRKATALQVSWEHYYNVCETAPLAFVIWDGNTRVVDWNKHAEALFGWSRDEVLGRSFFEFLIPDHSRPQVEEVVTQVPGAAESQREREPHQKRQDHRMRMEQLAHP